MKEVGTQEGAFLEANFNLSSRTMVRHAGAKFIRRVSTRGRISWRRRKGFFHGHYPTSELLRHEQKLLEWQFQRQMG